MALSGGERQRVALARAICSAPKLLLLDEPLGGLDVALRRRILPYLIRVRDAFEIPILFVSHDPTEVVALCDEVAVLEDGRIRARGRPSDVLAQREFAAGGRDNVLSGIVRSIEGGTARVAVAEGKDVLVPATGLGPGERAVFAIRGEDVLVATGRPAAISARNVLAARIERAEEDGETAWVAARLDDRTRVWAHVTPAAVRELGLTAGRDVHLVFKATSCRVLSSLVEGPASPATRDRAGS
jgi:molybdate transport system ATP-binding protein